MADGSQERVAVRLASLGVQRLDLEAGIGAMEAVSPGADIGTSFSFAHERRFIRWRRR